MQVWDSNMSRRPGPDPTKVFHEEVCPEHAWQGPIFKSSQLVAV